MDDREKHAAVWELRLAFRHYTDAEFATLLAKTGVEDAESLIREARRMAYLHLI